MKLAPILVSIVVFSWCTTLKAYEVIEAKIDNRQDGGYTIQLDGYSQHLKLITAEGFFPKQPIHYKIELIGPGKEWSYRNQPGYYYNYPDNLYSVTEHWDLGYAWVDENKEFIYLNLYWIDSPDSLKESRLNGKYRIK